MSKISNYIRIGFYENFKSYDSILISVDFEGLIEIEEVFMTLSNKSGQFDFLKLRLLDKDFSLDIKAIVDKENLGLKRITTEKYEWRLTNYMWDIFRQQLTGLRLNADNNGGHQYLDFEVNNKEKKENYIDIDSLQVVFSLFEYPLSFWQESKNKD